MQGCVIVYRSSAAVGGLMTSLSSGLAFGFSFLLPSLLSSSLLPFLCCPHLHLRVCVCVQCMLSVPLCACGDTNAFLSQLLLRFCRQSLSEPELIFRDSSAGLGWNFMVVQHLSNTSKALCLVPRNEISLCTHLPPFFSYSSK